MRGWPSVLIILIMSEFILCDAYMLELNQDAKLRLSLCFVSSTTVCVECVLGTVSVCFRKTCNLQFRVGSSKKFFPVDIL